MTASLPQPDATAQMSLSIDTKCWPVASSGCELGINCVMRMPRKMPRSEMGHCPAAHLRDYRDFLEKGLAGGGSFLRGARGGPAHLRPPRG